MRVKKPKRHRCAYCDKLGASQACPDNIGHKHWFHAECSRKVDALFREVARKRERKLCKARDPLQYGSKACLNEATFGSDICQSHSQQLEPHRLVSGILYMHVTDREE